MGGEKGKLAGRRNGRGKQDKKAGLPVTITDTAYNSLS